MRYDYYWPAIQAAANSSGGPRRSRCAGYLDVAREQGRGQGVAALMRLLKSPASEQPPFAPSFLNAGRWLIAQTPIFCGTSARARLGSQTRGEPAVGASTPAHRRGPGHRDARHVPSIGWPSLLSRTKAAARRAEPRTSPRSARLSSWTISKRFRRTTPRASRKSRSCLNCTSAWHGYRASPPTSPVRGARLSARTIFSVIIPN